MMEPRYCKSKSESGYEYVRIAAKLSISCSKDYSIIYVCTAIGRLCSKGSPPLGAVMYLALERSRRRVNLKYTQVIRKARARR